MSREFSGAVQRWARGEQYRLSTFRNGAILNRMNLQLAAVFRQFPEGYAAFVEELPGGQHTGGDLGRSSG
jgi:hypothetical protein